MLMTQLTQEASSKTDRIWVTWNWPGGNFLMHGYKVYAYILLCDSYISMSWLSAGLYMGFGHPQNWLDCKEFHDFTAPFTYKPLEVKFSKDCGIHSSASLSPRFLYRKRWKCFNHILVIRIKDPLFGELAERSYDDFSLTNLWCIHLLRSSYQQVLLKENLRIEKNHIYTFKALSWIMQVIIMIIIIINILLLISLFLTLQMSI